jgi:hypothetical protein
MSSAFSRPIHYILSSHWDREWYLPFQAFRQRMVGLFDQILDGFADGRLHGPFTLDGQSIPVEDYLEIRPGRGRELLELIREGKFRLGPWYVMPDEFLVSGESLIRNLRHGRSLARQYGGIPSEVAFLCDMFGHASQMPQIFSGFGIRAGFIWRGTNNSECRHLRWLGADGSELLCYRRNYCDFAFQVRRAGEPDALLTPKTAHEFLDAYVRTEAAATSLSPILLFDGGDHQFWDETVYKAVRSYRSDVCPEGVIHSDLDAYCEAMLRDSLLIGTTVAGELREPSAQAPPEDDQWVIPGCLASRVWIKQANAACEHLLTSWAEPWLVFLGENGRLATGYLDVAWRWLLQNHPHDSMGGCSIDQVHEDMRHRFSQCHQIAENVARDATRSIALQIGAPLSPTEVRCVVFNALPSPLEKEVVELDIPIPPSWKTHAEAHNFDFQPNFFLFNDKGEEIPWIRAGLPRVVQRPLLRSCKFPQLLKPINLRITVRIDLPACGYVTLTARENSGPLQVRHPAIPTIAVNDGVLDNGLLRVEVGPSGELILIDHRTGHRYERLLTMEDSGDIGDGWCHAAPFQDECYSSRALGARTTLLANTPYLATIQIGYHMEIPSEFAWGQGRRSERKIAIPIEHAITLKKGADHVEVETRINNTACDHRMRVLFPSGVKDSTSWLADTAFDVVERPIALRADNHLYRELEVETKPMQTWMAVHGASRGLAVVTEGGLLEGAVRDLPDRPLALTLFRSTKRTVFTDGEPGGQLLGPQRFRYALVPLQGAPDRSRLARLARQQAGVIRFVTVLPEEEAAHRTDGAARPPVWSFLEVRGQAVLTSFRFVNDDVEIRLFNPGAHSVESEIDVKGCTQGEGPPVDAQPINFEGTATGGRTEIPAGTFRISLHPKQICSYRLSGRG